MDPITAAISIAGLGVSLFGMGKSSQLASQEAGVASQEANVSKQITQLQMQENEQRRLAMQISARRSQTEMIRKAQLVASQGLVAGAAQGASFGSGVAGGQFQAQSEAAYNITGVNQNVEIGSNLFDIQNQVSNKQMSMADLQTQMANLKGQQSIWQGISAIGGSLTGSAGPLGNILGNFFGNKNDPSVSSTQGGQGLYSGAQTGNLY